MGAHGCAPLFFVRFGVKCGSAGRKSAVKSAKNPKKRTFDT